MFITGKPVYGKQFIDRKKHLPLFQTFIENHQSFMIKAPRRFGKTSIVKHLLQEDRGFIYIDVKRASTLRSLADTIIDKSYKLSSIENFIQRSKTKLLDLLKSVQSLKIDDIAEITIRFQEEKSDDVEYFLHSLDVMEKVAQKLDIEVKCVFDEFQDILLLSDKKILDKTRSVIQHHEKVMYIFLGSIETIMRDIFEKKSSAFYHFATIIDLPPLDTDELYAYSKKVFNDIGVSVSSLKNMLSFLGGHPDYSMQFLQKLYFNAIAMQKQEFSQDDLKEILLDTIEANRAYLEELISKAKQRKHNLEVLESIAKKQPIEIDSKILYNTKRSLEDMGLIKKRGRNDYVINDIFLELILRYKDDIGKIEFYLKGEEK